MINTNKLRDAVTRYKGLSVSSTVNRGATCTVRDLENLRDNTAKLLTAFIDTLEKG